MMNKNKNIEYRDKKKYLCHSLSLISDISPSEDIPK